MNSISKKSSRDDTNNRAEELVKNGIRNRWYCIAASREVTAEPIGLTRLGEKLVLWRDGDGLVHVLEDRCPHRGAPLSCGHVIDGYLTCRYHGVQLDGDGAVAKVPAFPDAALNGRRIIKAYPVIEHYGAIFAYFGDAAHPDPVPFEMPYELTSEEWTGFPYTETWGANYQYVLDNLVDPMHGPYLHSDSFALAYGTKEDTVEVTETKYGFELARGNQRNKNFDWLEFGDTGAHWVRVDIFYPPGGGPGGLLRVLCFITPIDEHRTQIVFWRCRQIQGWQKDLWRFLFKNKLERFAWEVLQQDREMLEMMPAWPAEEMLYQHDIGVSRLRLYLRKEAKKQIKELDRLDAV